MRMENSSMGDGRLLIEGILNVKNFIDQGVPLDYLHLHKILISNFPDKHESYIKRFKIDLERAKILTKAYKLLERK